MRSCILIFETGVHGKERQLAIDRFSDVDSNSFLFLLSTRAGGVGINLTAADRVIIFDSDWNPQNDVQAMARCHRIGQKKQVSVFRLITAKTYEAQMFERASMKLGLDQAVLHGMTSKVSKNALVGASKDEDYQPTKEELNEIMELVLGNTLQIYPMNNRNPEIPIQQLKVKIKVWYSENQQQHHRTSTIVLIVIIVEYK